MELFLGDLPYCKDCIERSRPLWSGKDGVLYIKAKGGPIKVATKTEWTIHFHYDEE